MCESCFARKQRCGKRGCGLPCTFNLKPCMQLQDFLESAYPDASAARASTVGAAEAAARETAAPVDGSSQGDEDDATGVWAATDASAVPTAPSDAAEQQTEVGAAAQAHRTADLRARRTADLRTHMAEAMDRFTHYFVGCDGCGVYPIVGRRYRCADCQESIGFDLCQECHAAGFAATGRFNQQHTAQHKMEEVVPRPNLLHLLHTLHPELHPNQLMEWIEMHEQQQDAGGAGEGDGTGTMESTAAASVEAALSPPVVEAVAQVSVDLAILAATEEAGPEEQGDGDPGASGDGD